MKKIIIILCSLSANLVLANVQLRDVGIIGLASHDMFAWDRKNEVNTENGRLDLSTIFDYRNGSRWEQGGDPKNGENSPVWSITKRLVNFYKAELINTRSSKIARLNTVKEFHRMVVDSFERLSGQSFPTVGIDQMVTNEEQAVLRAFHDILPGRVRTYRGPLYPIKGFKLTNFLFAKFYLNERELDQQIPYFDGDYDKEYKNIKIPFTRVVINLKEVDRKFIEKYSRYRQDEMLEELRLVGAGELDIQSVSFIHHIVELFQKGTCRNNNQWIQSNMPCN